jgi:non-homologous end joining protein Ku
VIDNAIVLTLLRYADELVDTSPLSFPGGEKPRKAELDESLMRLIKARIKGQKPRLPAPEGEPQASEVVDLMERLRQSLDSRKRPAHNAAKKSLPKAGKRAGRKARHAA